MILDDYCICNLKGYTLIKYSDCRINLIVKWEEWNCLYFCVFDMYYSFVLTRWLWQKFEWIGKGKWFIVRCFCIFLKFPNNHSNTIIVFNQLKELNTIYKEIQSNKYEVLSKWDNYKVRLFYDTTDKMQAIADAFEELLRTIAGYTSSGIEGTVMEVLLEPLLMKLVGRKEYLT